MKKISTLFVSVFCMALIISGCGGTEGTSGESQKTEKLKVAFNQPEEHPQFQAMEAFGEKFYERTDGAYEVEVSPNETLGAQRETLELTQSGTIAMSIVAGSLMESINEDFVVFNLPYVYDSKEHQMDVLNNEDITSDLYTSVEDDGLRVVGAFHGGVRNVYNKEQPINTPEDLSGMKIRVMESDTNVQMLERMGGVGTPMGQGEVYTAIQSGVLDGGENNELIYNDLKHVEVAPYYSKTQHLMVPDYLIINSDLFNDMSEEHQDIFMEEFQAAIEMNSDMFEEEVAAAEEEAIEAGAEFNDVDISVFQKEVEPLIEEKLTTDTTKDLYEKVREAAE
ncbi:TRAP transporter substrate-binding protein [Halobacillus shinanisalinarum]|uniref:TRAP transporter substrate-binding protein n=1 Tax=Halobacillus shinanisalinarum TaxID=2932258 RepID=A0ABY4GYW3_9BACI|nr:TRAP transporter substrate-binding protein [Halobacillus shinanisalinarum]UOQ93358.1 TRAP transporter substrate-binding protein [Halobacillus shinanisalinarum]